MVCEDTGVLLDKASKFRVQRRLNRIKQKKTQMDFRHKVTHLNVCRSSQSSAPPDLETPSRLPAVMKSQQPEKGGRKMNTVFITYYNRDRISADTN